MRFAFSCTQIELCFITYVKRRIISYFLISPVYYNVKFDDPDEWRCYMKLNDTMKLTLQKKIHEVTTIQLFYD